MFDGKDMTKERYRFCHDLASQQMIAQQFVCEAYMSLLPKVRRSPHPYVTNHQDRKGTADKEKR